MRPAWIRRAVSFLIAVTLFDASSSTLEAAAVDDVREALAELHAWVDQGPHGPAWRDYLASERLASELPKGPQADPAIVAEVLAAYCGDAPQLEMPQVVKVREALERWLAELCAGSLKDLAARARASKPAFLPPGKRAVALARTRLAAALRALDARLAAAGAGGRDWRLYLSWDALHAELAKGDQADPERLDAIYYKFDAGHEGLGLFWFSDVRQSLRDYLTAVRAVEQAELKDHYAALLDALAGHLETMGEAPTAEEAALTADYLGWLRDARQAPWLVAGVRRRFARPNLLAQVSADVVCAGVARPVDDVSPVIDVILGTDIRGTGHTVGQITARLARNGRMAEIDVLFSGTARSDTIGYNGPARVFSTGETALAASAKLWITPEGILASPATAQAQTRSTIDAIGLVRGGGLVERIAWKKACKTKPQAERIAARHAEHRLAGRIDGQLAAAAADANERLAERLRRPLAERRLLPERIELTSTEDALHVVALQAGEGQLAAPADPPALAGKPDLALRIHESMVNNSAASALSGAILTDEHLRRMGEEGGLLADLVKQVQSEQEGGPWTLHFAPQRPVMVSFAHGRFRITLRGQAFQRGETPYPGMDVTAEYRIEKTDQGFKAVRQGELRIFPPGFVPDSGEQLSLPEQGLRDLLKRRFAKIFPPEFVPEPGDLPGDWKAAGPVALCQWEARDGWLVMAWKRTEGADPAE